MTVYEKLASAKNNIACTKMEKWGKNSFSNYNYFTPEQVHKLVHDACDKNGLTTLFSLKRNEFGVYGELMIIDVESWEKIVVEWATAIPEIKATNVAQQIGGCMTYTERYLKMSAFGIIDNNLDFDTTENTKANNAKKFTDAEFKKFEAIKWQYKNGAEAIGVIETKYSIDPIMKAKVLSLYK